MFRRKKVPATVPQLLSIAPRDSLDRAGQHGNRPLSLDFDALDGPQEPLTKDERGGHPQLTKSRSVEVEVASPDADTNGHPYASRERQRKFTPPAPAPAKRQSPSLSPTPSPHAEHPSSPRPRIIHKHQVQIVPLMKPVSPRDVVPEPANGHPVASTSPASTSPSRSPRQPQNFHEPLSKDARGPKLSEQGEKSKSFDVFVPQQRQAFRHHHNVPRDEVERRRERRKNPPTPPPPYQSKSAVSPPSPSTNRTPAHPRSRPIVQIVPLMQPVDKSPTVSPSQSSPVGVADRRHQKLVISKSLDFDVPTKKEVTTSLSPDPTHSWSEHPFKQPSSLGAPLGNAPVVVRDRHAARHQRPASSLPIGGEIVTVADSAPKSRRPRRAQNGGLGPAPTSYNNY